MSAITVKPGDDIRWAGQITREGVEDFDGYTLTAHVRRRQRQPAGLSPVLAVAEITWLDSARGMFEFRIPRQTTRAWPVDAVLALDVRIESPDGTYSRTETAEFATVQGVTE